MSLPRSLSTEPLHRIYFGDNLEVLRSLPDGCANLIYIDPPFNTGKTRSHQELRVTRDEGGDRVGFGGRRYRTESKASVQYADRRDDFLDFLRPRLEEAYRTLASDGSFYFHIDYREAHYCKVMLDEIFGRDSFLNEIIWAYDYGGRPKRKWAPKHDNILVYVKDPLNYVFDLEAVERIPYMAPGLVTPEKAERGKHPTDTWWHTIVPTNSKEKTGYPTQKPLGIIRRIIAASSRKGDVVLDFFAGSGTTGAACAEAGRRFILVDENPGALNVMRDRFSDVEGIQWIDVGPPQPDADPVPRSNAL